MFKILLALTFFVLINFSLNFVSLVSNEWFSIFIRKNTCNTDLSDQCLLTGFERVLTVGYWFVCPTTPLIETTWVFNKNLQDICLFLKTHDKSLVIQLFSKKISIPSTNFNMF